MGERQEQKKTDGKTDTTRSVIISPLLLCGSHLWYESPTANSTIFALRWMGEERSSVFIRGELLVLECGGSQRRFVWGVVEEGDCLTACTCVCVTNNVAIGGQATRHFTKLHLLFLKIRSIFTD